jgi:hypothetical protein
LEERDDCRHVGGQARPLREKRSPDIDLVRVQDVFPPRTLDPVILEWATTGGRVVITPAPGEGAAAPQEGTAAQGQAEVALTRWRLLAPKPFKGSVLLS